MAEIYGCLCYLEKVPVKDGYTVQERDCFCKGKNIEVSEGEEPICPHTDQPLKHMGTKTYGFKGTTMTPDQVRAERRKRSRDHYKREVYPTLSSEDKKAHAHKLK